MRAGIFMCLYGVTTIQAKWRESITIYSANGPKLAIKFNLYPVEILLLFVIVAALAAAPATPAAVVVAAGLASVTANAFECLQNI